MDPHNAYLDSLSDLQWRMDIGMLVVPFIHPPVTYMKEGPLVNLQISYLPQFKYVTEREWGSKMSKFCVTSFMNGSSLN